MQRVGNQYYLQAIWRGTSEATQDCGFRHRVLHLFQFGHVCVDTTTACLSSKNTNQTENWMEMKFALLKETNKGQNVWTVDTAAAVYDDDDDDGSDDDNDADSGNGEVN